MGRRRPCFERHVVFPSLRLQPLFANCFDDRHAFFEDDAVSALPLFFAVVAPFKFPLTRDIIIQSLAVFPVWNGSYMSRNRVPEDQVTKVGITLRLQIYQ
jgi:hypothetical protein